MPDNVPEEVKIDRLNRMIALQNELSAASNRRDVGRTFDVLVEGVSETLKKEADGRPQPAKQDLCVSAWHIPHWRHCKSKGSRLIIGYLDM